MAVVIHMFFIVQILAGYICAKGIFCITQKTWLSVLAMLLSLTCVASFLAMTKDSTKFTWLLDGICYVGYVYLGFIVYFSVGCIAGFIFSKFCPSIELSKILSAVLVGVILILFAGYINAINPRLKKLTIPCSVNMKICFLSDIHVGSIGTNITLSKITKMINQIKPDLIILGGDVLDKKGVRDYQNKFIRVFSKITSKYKTVAVVGNHELYTGLDECLAILRKAGISVLIDENISVNGVNIVGRMDCSVFRRKPLSKILPKNNLPTIVVDHSPEAIDEAVSSFAFLQLSGHTHGGQIFPLNIATSLMYEPTGVLEMIKATYLYISYGAGFWGPPYRIGTIPEVVSIELRKTSF